MPRYQVQPGDTLTSIATKLGVTVNYLVERNSNISNKGCKGVVPPQGEYIYY